MLECLFDETGNDAVAQSCSGTSLCRRETRVMSGSCISSVRYGFGEVFWLGVELGRTSAWFGSQMARQVLCRA